MTFFLRAFTICRDEYLGEEIRHITDSFAILGYPEGLHVKLKERANAIMERRDTESEKAHKKYLVVPESDLVQGLGKALHHANYKMVSTWRYEPDEWWG